MPDPSGATPSVVENGGIVYKVGASAISGFGSDDIPDSAVYRWPVDEGSGQTLTDEIQSTEIGLNFSTWTSGSQYVGGTALSFDGVDDEGATSNALPEVTVSSNFSVEIWVDIDASASGKDTILYHHPNGNDRVAIGIDQDNSDYVAIGVYDGSVHELHFDRTQYSGLVQIVVTWDASASDVSLYHNTTESTTGGNVNFSNGDTSSPLTVGYHGGYNDHHTDCIIDLIQPHGEVLSQSQVNDLYGAHPST